MPECAIQEVCKHKRGDDDGECEITHLCKEFMHLEGQEPRPKKEKPVVSEDDDIGDRITEKQFKKASVRINYLRCKGKLDENQLAALEPTKGKHFKTLTEAQKTQIIKIAGLK